MYRQKFFQHTLILIFSFSLFIASSCAPSRQEASHYSEAISNAIQRVLMTEQKLMSSYAAGDSAMAIGALESLSEAINVGLEQLKEIGNFYDNESLRQEAFYVLRFFRSLADTHYKELLKIALATDTDFSASMQEKLRKKQMEADEGIKVRLTNFLRARARFEEEYGLEPGR